MAVFNPFDFFLADGGNIRHRRTGIAGRTALAPEATPSTPLFGRYLRSVDRSSARRLRSFLEPSPQGNPNISFASNPVAIAREPVTRFWFSPRH
jgi:hypothetical protein